MGERKRMNLRGSYTAIVLLAVLLSACTSFSVFKEEFPKFKGKHIDTLIAKLGMPNEETSILGKTAYIWRTSEHFTSLTPEISSSTGTVGTTPVVVTTYSTETTTKKLKCQIRIFVDEEGLITNGDWEGSNGTCFRYSERLKPTSSE